MRAARVVLAGLMAAMGGLAEAQAAVIAQIDLNDFFADPSVTVALDGSSATVAEDAVLTPVLLANDPFLGDPEVIVAGAGVSLIFEFDFTEGPAGEDDEFGAFVIDAGTGLSAGAAFEFFTEDSSTGSVAFDLTGLVGTTLGLQFQLLAFGGDTGLDSLVRVSNLRLESSVPVPVPAPSSLALLAVGLMIVWPGCARRRRQSE